MKHTVVCSTAVLILVLALAGCAASSTQGPRTWFDQPLDGAKLAVEPQQLTAHASDADGVASLEFYVDGAPLIRAPAGGGVLGKATVAWNPSGPGVYTISVKATDTQGNVGAEARTVVTVGEVEGSPEPSPTLVPTEEIVTGETPSPEVPAPTSPVPSETPRPATPRPTSMPPTRTPVPPTRTPVPPTRTPLPPTATPPPARRAEITYFQANPATINAGGCSTLSWDVQYAAAVYLDGQGVTAPNTQQVCPPTTTTFTLHATSAGGDDQETAIVTVIEAPSPTPIVTVFVPDFLAPYVTDLDANPDSIEETAFQCPGDQTTVSVFADDPSGVANVVAYWWLGLQNGQANMSPVGGLWKAVLGPFDQTGTLQVWFVAQDGVGNSNDPPVGPINVTVTDCLG